MEYYGYEPHYWDLDFWKAPIFLRLNLSRALLYSITLGVCKASIIFLYQRIFDTQNVLRWVLWGTHLFNILLALSYFLATIFVWRPFACHFMINLDDSCIKNDVWDGEGANAAVNAALDLWLIIVPAFAIWKLQMKISKRINLIAIFATGFLFVHPMNLSQDGEFDVTDEEL